MFSACTSIKVAALLNKITDLPQEHFSPLDPILYHQLFSQASLPLRSGLVFFAGWSQQVGTTNQTCPLHISARLFSMICLFLVPLDFN